MTRIERLAALACVGLMPMPFARAQLVVERGPDPPLYQAVPAALHHRPVSLARALPPARMPREALPEESDAPDVNGCAATADAGKSVAFARYQKLTRQQAAALQLRFPGPADDPAGRHADGAEDGAARIILVWRAGEWTQCSTPTGTTVIYGGEWDLAVDLAALKQPGAASFAELFASANAGRAQGVVRAQAAGFANPGEALQQAERLGRELQQALRTGVAGPFVKDFAASNASSNRMHAQTGPMVQLGFVASAAGRQGAP